MPTSCGWQVPGNVPGSFDWWLFGTIGAAGSAGTYVSSNGIPVISKLLGMIVGSGPVTGLGLASAVAGAILVIGLVAYYLFRPDGCIRSKPRSEPICSSGIIEQITDLRSTAIQLLAPFAMGPSFTFDLVLKTIYLPYATQNADFIICSPSSSPMLRCVIENKLSCAARIGSIIGAVAGGIAGIILGYLAGAAVASLSCGIFAWLCFIVALLVALIVAAVVTYAGATAGGLVGEGLAALGDDPVEEAAGSLGAGAIVTVHGDWCKNPDFGYNELFYVNAINRTGNFQLPPSYSTADADLTPADDCPLSPPVIG